MIIPFGRHRGEDTSAIEDSFLMWLTDADNLNQVLGKPWETDKFRVREKVALAARQELEKRGYKRKGMRWER